ncbi:enoyl-CoA hydratase/isomerase family protein [Paradesulfitobacterium ferrireducens]|uniref:enoyl-CoA hydratase/isomerase family protein n=1 Tax=Paradesulfitobacterium ferrireducens TaxID=2816476 RepID=UPI001A90412B|nr:enoyl-CoA hydratase/isomerase family protein [Paradesulfitobacterium ferrireducens]
MDYSAITVQIEQATAIVMLNRSGKMNAISMQMRQELADAFQKLGQDKDVRCIILTGGDKVFCAGVDVKESPGYMDILNSDLLYRVTQRRYSIYQQVEWCPKVTIAASEGYTFGGGFELFLACDLRVASESAKFGFPEARRATLPGGGGTQRLVREVGPARAKELIITGRTFDTLEAKEFGILNHVVESGQALAKAKQLASEITSVPGTVAVVAKWAINSGMGMPQEYALDYEASLCTILSNTRERQERLHDLGK